VIAWSTSPFWLKLAALVSLLAAGLLPPITRDRPVYDLVAVLDITGSMNVRDQRLDGGQVSRIAMEKRSVATLLSALPCGSRLGLAVFVEAQPFLLFTPVETCESYDPLSREIAVIDWRMGWDSESHIAETLRRAAKLSIALQADLVFMTDGQETPPLAWSSPVPFADLRGTARGMILGVGGHTLVPIPKYDMSGHEIGVFQPGDVPSEHEGLFRGREHLSAVDEPHLQSLAQQSGLAYAHLESAETLTRVLLPLAKPRLLPTRWSLAPGLAAAAILLIVLSWVGERSGPFLKKRTKKLLSI